MVRGVVFAIICSASGLVAGPPEHNAWDSLQKAAASSDSTTRRQAVAALGTLGAGNGQAVTMIQTALRTDKNPLVRQTAAAVLGEMKARQAIPDLEAAMDDKNTGVGFTAARALADIGDENAPFGMFMDVLTGERKDAPSKTQSALQYAKKKFLRPQDLLLMGVNDTSTALLGPGSLGIVAGEEAVENAVRAEDPFKDKGAAGRALAATYMAKENDPYALTLLEWALGDSNWAVRAAAAKAVGERGNTASVPRLEPLLKDGKAGVRTMAAASIIRISSGDHNNPKEAADRVQQ